MATRRQRTGWSFVVLTSLLITLVFVIPYLTLNEDRFFEEQKQVYLSHTFAIVVHVAASAVALLLGPTQFLARFRRPGRAQIHRWLGRAYLAGVAVGGVSGLRMAFLAYGGWIARIGFVSLACAWLYTGYHALATIRRGEIQAHRRWMTRNYSLTFAAVTLRLWLGVAIATDLDFENAYRVVAWLAWVPNLLLIEHHLQRGQRPRAGTVTLTP